MDWTFNTSKRRRIHAEELCVDEEIEISEELYEQLSPKAGEEGARQNNSLRQR